MHSPTAGESGAVLLACEAGFLLTAGAPLASSSSQYFPSTPALRSLQRVVGGSLVGQGKRSCLLTGASQPYLGLTPEVNDAYGIRMLTIYDPVYP